MSQDLSVINRSFLRGSKLTKLQSQKGRLERGFKHIGSVLNLEVFTFLTNE